MMRWAITMLINWKYSTVLGNGWRWKIEFRLRSLVARTIGHFRFSWWTASSLKALLNSLDGLL